MSLAPPGEFVDALKGQSSPLIKIVVVADKLLVAYTHHMLHTHLDTFLLPLVLYFSKLFLHYIYLLCSCIYKIAQDDQKKGTEM